MLVSALRDFERAGLAIESSLRADCFKLHSAHATVLLSGGDQEVARRFVVRTVHR